ncbi:MAG: selenocysteine-specific translation elongation factor, partial [Planctomycetota bacterium]|nr:selenocysteine-specific translation elongation factor [Planctomycetota bacterium]
GGTRATNQRYLLLGTAGHIDHGKTSLIKALTGVDTDRLPEEKRRGMTIELGFAHLEVGVGADAVRFGIVDVPGHEKFVRTMVAGATAIDLVLLVVAADDSVMPQTREHFDIIHLLGVQHGVVAVSKCDLVDAEMAELVADEVRELLAGSPLADAPIVNVSATTRRGLDELKRALHAQAQAVAQCQSTGMFRLAIDRVFTIHGRGTVVTGSAVSGTVSVGETLELLPAGRRCKVRGLQTHFDQADELRLGQRVAVNLTGVEKEEVHRGDELARPGCQTPSRMLDVQLHTLSGGVKPLKHLQRVRLCMGTRECFARVRLLCSIIDIDEARGPTPESVGSSSGRPPCRPSVDESAAGRSAGTPTAPGVVLKKLSPGGTCFAQLETAEPVVAEWGRRFIIRDETDARTIGGGVVLRPVSRRLARRDLADIAGLKVLLAGDGADRIEEVFRFESGQVDELKLACLSGVPEEAVNDRIAELKQADRLMVVGDSGQLVAASMIEDCCRRATERLRQFHHKHPDDPGYPMDSFVGWLKGKWGEGVGAYMLEQLKSGSSPALQVLGCYCCLTEFAPKMSAQDQQLLKAIIEEFNAAAFQPPAASVLKCTSSASKARVNKLIKIATATGELVQIAPDILLHAGRLEQLKKQMAEAITERGGLAVADVRTMIDSSRKYVVPLVEYLDRSGFTKRVGDQRVLADG